jgi:DNA-binding transcriptional regulator LsrR (DeoR family)
MAKMLSADHERMLVKVSRLYYEHELTQSQISQRLGLSRQKVQRLLKEARQAGIVQINIRPLMDTYENLELKLAQDFGLREAVIVETSDYQDHATVTREIGAAAAEFLLRIVQPGNTIAVSWGSTLQSMVNALSTHKKSIEISGITIVQGLGGMGDPVKEIHAADLTRRLAQIFGGQAVLLPAPGVAGSINAARAFLNDPYVENALSLAASADIAIMGIGAPRRDSLLIKEGTIVTYDELAELEKLGAIGDINLRFFNHQGDIVPSSLNERVIGLSLDSIREIKTVVGIAGGEAKFSAIYGAAHGQLVDILVTDNITASRLLEKS